MKKYKYFMVVIFLLILSGCVSRALVKNMAPAGYSVKHKFNSGLYIKNVNGGAEQHPKRYSAVINDDLHGPLFRKAIAKTFSDIRMFNVVSTVKKQQYTLETDIVFQDTDFARVSGGSFTFTLNAKYTIKASTTNKVLYSNQFTSSCIKTLDDALGGAARHALALECSVHSNLTQLIEDLNHKKL